MEHIPIIIFQLSIIIIFAKIFGELFQRFLNLPSVLGELITGLIIGPYALGGISFFGLEPLFGIDSSSHSSSVVGNELLFLSHVAAIILLFQIGIETDREKFKKYALPATFVAMGGVFFPFILGFFATIWFGYANASSINGMVPALFMGAMLTATSVGVTARVLSDLGVLDSKEGSTIMASAVLDDVLGVIILAAVVGIVEKGEISALSLVLIFAKAIGFWLALLIIGSITSNYISSFFSSFKVTGSKISMTLALAFLSASIAEHYFGLAMIIGSYTVGLALSGTEIKHSVEKSLFHINSWLVPIFFVVIGMQADFISLWHNTEGITSIILFIIVISIFAIISKVFGCGIPAFILKFSKKEAYRVGIGMLPRGEIALIIASVGISYKVIDQELFGISIIMIIITTILAPILLYKSYKN